MKGNTTGLVLTHRMLFSGHHDLGYRAYGCQFFVSKAINPDKAIDGIMRTPGFPDTP